MKKDIKLLFIAKILACVVVLLQMIPSLGLIGSLASLACLVLFIVGLFKCKKFNPTFGKAIKSYISSIVVTVVGTIIVLILGFVFSAAMDGNQSLGLLTIITSLAEVVVVVIAGLCTLRGDCLVIKGTGESFPRTRDFAVITKKVYVLAVLLGFIAAIIGVFALGGVLGYVSKVLQAAADVMVIILLAKASKLSD